MELTRSHRDAKNSTPPSLERSSDVNRHLESLNNPRIRKEAIWFSSSASLMLPKLLLQLRMSEEVRPHQLELEPSCAPSLSAYFHPSPRFNDDNCNGFDRMNGVRVTIFIIVGLHPTYASP
jgi:hypothetical protein